MNAAFAGSATSQANLAAAGRKINPLASFRRHRRASATVAIAVTIAGLMLAAMKGKPTYMAEAAVRISPVFSKTLQEDTELRFNSNSDYREFVQQQVVDIDSYETAQAALDQLGAKRWLWQHHGETDRHAAERLMATLAVHPVLDTYLVTISLESSKRAGLADIVNAVAYAYLKLQQGQELYGSDRRVQLLLDRRKQLEDQIEEATRRQAELAQELGISSFEEKFINPYDKELIDANAALDAARRARIDAEARLAALQSHLERTGDLPLDSQAMELLANDRALDELRAELYQRKAAVFLQLRGLALGHPGRPALVAELSDIDRELAKVTDQALGRIRKMLLDARDNKQKEELSLAASEVERSRRIEDGLGAELDQLRGKVAEFADRYNEALNLRAQSDAARQQITTIDDRINFLNLETKAPGFVRLASEARPPEVPVKGGRSKIFALFMVAGIALGAAVPVAVDYLDPRVLSAGELHKALGFPPLGVTLDGREQLTLRARDLIKHIALGITREWRASNNRIFVLAGCHRGAGTSTLALQLAREISALGTKAIAIEANLDHADRRYRLTPAAPGLIEVLSGRASPSEAVSPASEELPARMPVGNVFDFHRVWKLEELRQLFTRLCETYDLILIDAPPLLDSAEPELLIGLPAGVLLLVPAKEYAAVVRQALRLLERLSPPVVGAVLSRVPFSLGADGESKASILPLGIPIEPITRWFWHDSE